MQLKSIVESELNSAAISAQGKNLFISPSLASLLFLYLIGEVTKCLSLKLLFLVCPQKCDSRVPLPSSLPLMEVG